MSSKQRNAVVLSVCGRNGCGRNSMGENRGLGSWGLQQVAGLDQGRGQEVETWLERGWVLRGEAQHWLEGQM